MADDNNTGANTSPAPQAAIEVPTESAAYAEWRITGKLPESPSKKPPKSEAPATSRNGSAAPEEGVEKASSASEAGEEHQQEKRSRSNAESRLNEILSDLRRAGLSPAELKSFKREFKEAEAPPKAVPEKTVQPADPRVPKKPIADDFKTWEEYEAARDKYFEDVADYKAAKKLEDHLAQQQAEAQNKEVRAKMEDAKRRYGDEAEGTIKDTANALWNDQQIPGALKDLVGGSDVLADVLYVLGSKSEDLESFVEQARTNPAAAVRKFVLLEHLVQEELQKGKSSGEPEIPARDESGKFTKTPPPAKPVTSAPPPPREASGRSSAPPDEVESASKDGDFARYREAANRREIERRRGR